jgi:hypothetical protein
LAVRVSFDWNQLLVDMNRRFDGLAAAARHPTSTQRFAANNEVWRAIKIIPTLGETVRRWTHAAVSRRARTELLGLVMANLVLPASEAAMKVQDRAIAEVDLVCIAAALAEYRAKHGMYPASISELIPEIVPVEPLDYNGKSYIYKRADDGFLLYSVGNNGIDEGASNSEQSLHQGRPLDDLSQAEWKAQPATGFALGDDWPIRMPRPPLKIPHPPAESD